MADRDELAALRARGERLLRQAIERLRCIRSNGHHPDLHAPAEPICGQLRDLRGAIHADVEEART